MIMHQSMWCPLEGVGRLWGVWHRIPTIGQCWMSKSSMFPRVHAHYCYIIQYQNSSGSILLNKTKLETWGSKHVFIRIPRVALQQNRNYWTIECSNCYTWATFISLRCTEPCDSLYDHDDQKVLKEIQLLNFSFLSESCSIVKCYDVIIQRWHFCL